MSVANMQFKLADISLKSLSRFESSGKFLKCVLHIQLQRGLHKQAERKGMLRFYFIFYLTVQGLVTFVIHLVAALFFSQTTSTEGCQPESDCL